MTSDWRFAVLAFFITIGIVGPPLALAAQELTDLPERTGTISDDYPEDEPRQGARGLLGGSTSDLGPIAPIFPTDTPVWDEGKGPVIIEPTTPAARPQTPPKRPVVRTAPNGPGVTPSPPPGTPQGEGPLTDDGEHGDGCETPGNPVRCDPDLTPPVPQDPPPTVIPPPPPPKPVNDPNSCEGVTDFEVRPDCEETETVVPDDTVIP